MCHHGSCEADPLKKSKSPVLLWIDVLFLGDETFLRMHFKQITQKIISLASINRRSRKMNHWHHEKPWPSEQATCPLWDLDFFMEHFDDGGETVTEKKLFRNQQTWKIHQPGRFGAENPPTWKLSRPFNTLKAPEVWRQPPEQTWEHHFWGALVHLTLRGNLKDWCMV